MIRIKQGADFDFVGQLTNDKVPYPLAGVTLSADCRSAVYFEFEQHMEITIVDLATALVRIRAVGADTKKWHDGLHLIDVRAVKPDGKVLVSNTVPFEVLQTVTQGA
ncbi:hypothetical protein [Caballeronia sp. TF1N1]|uniref:hypothetical protein n=1 Tax=Caballeronia sp. TF1N1 TaxID=2878153 RepID=UPI001FD553CF|nr:hypothetical protein [Caballeronia sp. TF1N1]